MTGEERAKALEWWEQSRQEFLAAIDGVSEAQWAWKPAPERWSLGEVAEHIVLAEVGLTLNACHWLIYAPMHTLRHVKQMLEVKGTAGYPG